MRRSRRRQLKASAKSYSRSKRKVSPAPRAPFQLTAALNTLLLIADDSWVRNSSTRASTNPPGPVTAAQRMCLPRSRRQKSSDNDDHQTPQTHHLHPRQDRPAELSQPKAPGRVKHRWQAQGRSVCCKEQDRSRSGGGETPRDKKPCPHKHPSLTHPYTKLSSCHKQPQGWAAGQRRLPAGPSHRALLHHIAGTPRVPGVGSQHPARDALPSLPPPRLPAA